MKILIVGDVHGNLSSIKPKIEWAGRNGIQHVLQVGDFGLWTHVLDGQTYLDEIQKAAEKAKLTVYAIGGNHENWDHWEWMVEHMPKSKGFAMIRSRVALAPKIHHWHWDSKQFISAGGAVSVDREWRLQKEAGTAWEFHKGTSKATGERTLYWPNEVLTDQDVDQIATWNRKADYLITHDCSNYTPFRGRLKPDPESEIHRRRIDEVLKHTKPDYHWHGHMHTRYDWMNGMSSGYEYYTQTYGLEADLDRDSWGVLDTTDDTWLWRGVERGN